MSISIFLARFFGLYFIIIGLFYLFRRPFLKKAAMEFFEKSSLIVLTGVLNLFIGLLVILGHNVWEWNWSLVITVTGYLILLKGLTRLFVPAPIEKKWVLKFINKDNPIYFGFICLIIGFFLTYEGFFGR